MNKRIILSFALILALLFALCACGSPSPDGTWADPNYSEYQLVLSEGSAQVLLISDGTAISTGTYTTDKSNITISLTDLGEWTAAFDDETMTFSTDSGEVVYNKVTQQ